MDAPHPILGCTLTDENSSRLDLDAVHLHKHGIDPRDDKAMSAYIFTGQIRYGGYLEKRSIYRQSPLFAEEKEARDIHLGVDFWLEENHSIYAPWDACVVGCSDNKGLGNYGPTLILEHNWHGKVLYSLFGHLGRSVLDTLKAGDRIRAGTVLGSIGGQAVNGGWLPHLHFQLILDLGDNSSDYPGVCSEGNLDFFSDNCPNPSTFGLCPSVG